MQNESRRPGQLLLCLVLLLFGSAGCSGTKATDAQAAGGSGAAGQPVIAEVEAAEAALAAELHLAFVRDPKLRAGAVTATVKGTSVTLSCPQLCNRDGAAAFALAQEVARKANPAITIAPCTGLVACEGSGETPSEPEGARDLEVLVGSNRALPVAAAGANAAAAPLDRPATYRIGPGDTLSKIAAKTMGDGSLWEEVYKINRDKIGANPAKLQMGMELRIPQE